MADLVPIDVRYTVARNESDHRSVISMRERHARVRRNAQRRRHAGDYFEWNPGLRQRLSFFAAAAENEWIATFEPHHS